MRTVVQPENDVHPRRTRSDEVTAINRRPSDDDRQV
jgi:hypothetical protein